MPMDTDSTDNKIPCTWDSTPLTMKGWLRMLPKQLVTVDSRFRTMWEQGYVLSKNQVLAPSETHACALRDSVVIMHSFKNSIDSSIFENADLDDGV